jgi:hypothetical protein
MCLYLSGALLLEQTRFMKTFVFYFIFISSFNFEFEATSRSFCSLNVSKSIEESTK